MTTQLFSILLDLAVMLGAVASAAGAVLAALAVSAVVARWKP